MLAPAAKRHPLEDPGPPTPGTPSQPTPPNQPALTQITGTVRGFWGFDPFTGPTVPLQEVPGLGWKVLSGEPLIVGHKQDHLVLASTGSACVESITFDTVAASDTKATVKLPDTPAAPPNALDVTIPLDSTNPGSLQLAIHQYGVAVPTPLSIRTYSEPARVEALTLHAGDRTALLSGQHLDQVRQVRINDLHFTSAAPTVPDKLPLALPADAPNPNLHPGEKLTARITLTDGRDLDLPFTVAPPRPNLTLRSRSTPHDAASPIKLVSKDDLRIDEPITVILKSPNPIPRTEEIEVASQDPSPDATPQDNASSKLTFASGALVLQDSHTLRATFDPLKLFGMSIFGPIRLRAIQPGTDPGDWIPIANLVRLPTVSTLLCPSDPLKPCSLTGSSLFLIDAIGPSATLDGVLTDPVSVPEDFADTTLAVPHPAGGILYIRPRDDRAAIATLTLPIQPEPTSVRPSRPPSTTASTR